jgi:hypothetical protein
MSSPDEKAIAEKRAAVYDQDCEFLRYHGSFMWSRFQTAVALEGGTLYLLFASAVSMSTFEKVALILLSAVVVGLIFRIALRDAANAGVHLRRVAQYEQGCVAYDSPKWTGPKGYALLRMAMALVNFANLGLLIDFGMKLR